MSSTPVTPDRVTALVEQAARPIPLLWPLTSAVAANPLWDLRDRPFSAALAEARRVLGIAGLPPAGLLAEAFRAGRITLADLGQALEDHVAQTDPGGPGSGDEGPPAAPMTLLERHDQLTGGSRAREVDREVAKYCAAYVGDQLPLSPAEPGFLASWRAAVAHDPTGRKLHLRAVLHEMGASPDAVITTVADHLRLDEQAAVQELTAQLARLPGWAAHAKWRSWWAAPDRPGPALHLLDYLAVRLVYDLAALTRLGGRPVRAGSCAGAGPDSAQRPTDTPGGLVSGQMGERFAALDPAQQGLVWLAAYEGHYRDRLLAALHGPVARRDGVVPTAQVVCCIDVRAEGLRRHLESRGAYDTLGFAGFFGMPARLWPFASDEPLDLCPVLLRPSLEVSEGAADGTRAGTAAAGLRQSAAARRAADRARKGAVAPYLLAEAGGFALGPLALLRTAAPTVFAHLRRQVRRHLEPQVDPLPMVEGPGAPSDDDQAAYAEAALRGMGLTGGFAPLVVLCGHGSTTENNPYASALDCGACGAARGGASARLAAAIFNRPEVRVRLRHRGIRIPQQTVFVAAEHDTTDDTVTLFPPDGLDSQARARLAALRADLVEAGVALAAERTRSLPGSSDRSRRRPERHVAARSVDWAQVQPEWGLARCAAFIVGPRRLTAGIDLERRVFLHSYEPDGDPDGSVLEAILTGPMVVAQWISAAYYHSTVDPEILGAGDKVAHNVVAGIGVYQGVGGDLKLGLPRQAVFRGNGPYHEPMRLLVVIAAPRDRIDAVIARQAVLGELADGGWVNLVAREHDTSWLRRPGGEWRCWKHADPARGHDRERK